jgi:type VI secretion system secreted protein VgrG
MAQKKVEFHFVGDGLPGDAVAAQFDLEETLSRPYEARVAFSTQDESFSPKALLRTSVTLVVVDGDRGRERTLSGIVDRCELVQHDGVAFLFAARLVPPVASLAHREDCRIFQDMSAVDAVKEVLTTAGIDRVEWRTTLDYPKREYIVQYRESQLDFVHRLLEEEGIFYFFSHQDGEATMILADSTSALVEELAVPTVLSAAPGAEGTDPVTHLSMTSRLATSLVHLRDFDFEKPAQHPDAAQPSEAPFPMPHYEFPAGFKDPADGQRRANARLRELRTGLDELTGSTVATNLEVGKLVTVVGAAQALLNRTFVITRHTSRGRQSQTGQGASAAGGHVVEAGFAAMPEGAHFAPPRRTKKPRILGLHTAVVTGPSMGEEEIHTDKYGRVKVRFRWDRVAQFDDKSSCWIRVAQANLGGQFIVPRVGWEVAVGFTDGDPDKPLVLGRLYNAERAPPYALPGAKTSGAIKSASSPGGAGMNEIKLGDSGGSQGFSLTAEKDLNVTVGNDQNETVGVDESSTIKVNASHSVAGDRTFTVGGNRELNVGSNVSANVGGSLSETVGGNQVENSISNMVEKVDGDRSYSVGGNMTLICNGIEHSVTGDVSRTVGALMLTGSVASQSQSIAGNHDETVGAAKVDLCKGSYGETIAGNLNATVAVGEIHVAKGSYATEAGGSMTNLVGGLHYAKVDGDFSITAPMITLIGAVGSFKGGGSEIKLGGAPVLVKGSKVAIETAMLVKLGGNLTMGS